MMCFVSHENVWCLSDLSWYQSGKLEFERIGQSQVWMNGEYYWPSSFVNYNNSWPQEIQSDSMVCCGEIPSKCTCKKSWKITWKECLDYLATEKLTLGDLYHPDTESTCNTCKYKDSYRCIPIRDMLAHAVDWNQGIELITNCNLYTPLQLVRNGLDIELDRTLVEMYEVD